MEKKNTILLTVIAVATLLVAVVGATFAYFTATAGSEGDAKATGTATSATIAEVGLQTTASTGSSNPIYPGTMNYATLSVVGTQDGESTNSATYDITYSISGTITVGDTAFAGLNEGTYATYTVYRTTKTVASPISCETVTATPNAGGTRYSQTCNMTALTGATGAEEVASGNLESTSTPISITDQVLNSDGATTYYYYAVVTYPNQDRDQNDDQGKTVTITLNRPVITSTAQVGA